MLVANNISYAIKGKNLIEDISVFIEQGKILSILGPNGAGKSTLLKCLAGFQKITGGDIFLDDQPFDEISLEELSRKRAVLTQQVSLEFPFSVLEVASLGRRSHSTTFTGANDTEIVREALALTSTIDLEKRNFATLSGGEQQRVHLARVIAQLWEQENGILMLDEPTSALDLKHQFMLFDICRDLCERKGFAIVTVLHDLRLAKAISDNALFLGSGHVFANGKSDAVITTETICDLYEVQPHQAQLS